ncbi:hypothetical protein PFISCL1PPCAC_9810, partial [Pristionchus fissidentatus]
FRPKSAREWIVMIYAATGDGDVTLVQLYFQQKTGTKEILMVFACSGEGELPVDSNYGIDQKPKSLRKSLKA